MQIGFIDFSKDERNKVLSTLKLLGDHTALDELGIGVIRDFYADVLFPGISTIQTRAKYLVLIPYLFQELYDHALHERSFRGRNALQWLHWREDQLVETLVRNSKPFENGIIGSLALKQKRSVKQKPSAIYWSGLRTFDILRADSLSVSAACSAVLQTAKKKRELEIRGDDDSFDDSSAANTGKVLFSPIRPDYDLDQEASIYLTRKEAEFLERHILRSVRSRESLLAFLLKNRLTCDSFDSIPEHLLPEQMRIDYQLASSFSRFIYGAHIRYNVVYSAGCGAVDPNMEAEFLAWLDDYIQNPCDLGPVLDRANCNRQLASFCRQFEAYALQGKYSAMDDLIAARERTVKGDRAKLRRPKEYQYQPDAPVHAYYLNYRFDRASTIIKDIIDGLEE